MKFDGSRVARCECGIVAPWSSALRMTREHGADLQESQKVGRCDKKVKRFFLGTSESVFFRKFIN